MRSGDRTLKKQRTLRPTSNKVRVALFNILRAEIGGAVFLDLYAGTGAVGIDALVEGAAEVVFVEESRSSSGKVKALIEKLRLQDRARVFNRKAVPFIEWAELNSEAFDIIFLDPPYHTEEIMSALSAIGSSRILKQDGVVIAEHFVKRDLPDEFHTLHKIKDYHYGDTVLSFYRK